MKYMNLDKCWVLLTSYGGEVVYVYSTDDYMLSYELYMCVLYELYVKLYVVCEWLWVDGGMLIY